MPTWIMILLTIIAILLGSPVVSKIIEIIAKKRARLVQKVKMTELKYHSVFDVLEYSLMVRIKQLDFDGEFRSNVFRDLLYVRFRLIRYHLNKILTHLLEKSCNTMIFKQQVNILLYRINLDCSIELEKLDIPKVRYIIDRFENWNRLTNDFIIKSVRNIVDSKLFRDETERIQALLDVYQTALEVTLLDVESGLRGVNGSLNGLSYKSKLT